MTTNNMNKDTRRCRACYVRKPNEEFLKKGDLMEYYLQYCTECRMKYASQEPREQLEFCRFCNTANDKKTYELPCFCLTHIPCIVDTKDTNVNKDIYNCPCGKRMKMKNNLQFTSWQVLPAPI